MVMQQIVSDAMHYGQMVPPSGGQVVKALNSFMISCMLGL